MNTLLGYWRTLRQYLATAKGRHDFLEYIQAILMITATIAVVWTILRFFI